VALGGLSKADPFEFILESDQGLDSDFQTIFFVRQQSQKEINTTAAKIQNLQFSRTGKKKDLRPTDLDQLDKDQWHRVVVRVENFYIGDGLEENVYAHFGIGPETKPIVLEVSGKEQKFFKVDVVEDEIGLEFVRELLRDSDVIEIIEFSNSIGMLTGVQKKS